VVAQFIKTLQEQRGRFPVANLAADYLSHAHAYPFCLGDWIGLISLSDLEDIQYKLEQFLAGGGPDHAAEDLMMGVRLVSMAEAGANGSVPHLSSSQVFARLASWHEANMLEKLRRRELVFLKAGLSIDPAVKRAPVFHTSVGPALVERFAAA
jgi:hypothetical protein